MIRVIVSPTLSSLYRNGLVIIDDIYLGRVTERYRCRAACSRHSKVLATAENTSAGDWCSTFASKLVYVVFSYFKIAFCYLSCSTCRHFNTAGSYRFHWRISIRVILFVINSIVEGSRCRCVSSAVLLNLLGNLQRAGQNLVRIGYMIITISDNGTCSFPITEIRYVF